MNRFNELLFKKINSNMYELSFPEYLKTQNKYSMLYIIRYNTILILNLKEQSKFMES